jgi:hypothetical protein
MPLGGLCETDPRAGAPAPFADVAWWAHARRKIYDVLSRQNRLPPRKRLP